jgi:regulatory protein
MTLFEKINPELKKALGMSLRYLSLRERSILEMHNYLSTKDFNAQVVEKIIERLKQENYLNDKRFARIYLENRKRNKPKSIFALRYELVHKGIKPSIIDGLLTGYDDIELAFLAVQPKLRSWKHLEKQSQKKKMLNYLRYRGFSFSVCQSTWQRIFSSMSKTCLEKDLGNDP